MVHAPIVSPGSVHHVAVHLPGSMTSENSGAAHFEH